MTGSRRYLVWALALISVLAALLFLAPGTSAGPGHHVKSETPGSNQAVIFSPFGPKSPDDKASMDYFKSVVQEQNYVVTEYLDATESSDDNPGGATAANFKNLSQKGLVYVVSHGDTGPNVILVEAYKTEAARDTAFAAYVPPQFAAGDLVECDDFGDHNGNDTFGICITEQGVTNQFVDKDSIVHIAACFSSNFKEEFNAREYFSYSVAIACPTIRADTERLWGRMHGDVDDGARRAASRAYAGGGFSANFEYLHKAGVALQTVLSPAVEDHRPLEGAVFKVPTSVPGKVVFDTKMDTAIDPATVVKLTFGCDATITNAAWDPPYAIDFTLNLNTPGTGTIDVNWTNAKAERNFKNNLDGNRASRTPLRDHVGPNQDNFFWQVDCIEEKVEPMSGNYDLLVTWVPAAGEVPGSYFHCKADIQLDAETNDLTTGLYCYVDSPSITVNAQDAGASSCPPADASVCGDGLPGVPPPWPAGGAGSFGDVDDPHTVLAGRFDKDENLLLTEGCFQNVENLALGPNMYWRWAIDAQTLQGTIDVWFQRADCSDPGATPPDIDDGSIEATKLQKKTDPETGEPLPASDQYDSDQDGCSDKQELTSGAGSQRSGGLRDPYNYWDFRDVPAGGALLRDKAVVIQDISAVVSRFGKIGTPTDDPVNSLNVAGQYHTAYDTSGGILGSAGNWNLRGPDGAIVIQDIQATVAQFGHNCL